MSAISDSKLGARTKFAEATNLLRSRNIGRALASFDCAEQLGYEAAQCASGRWTCWMLLGDFERAWQESDRIAALGRDCYAYWNGASWAEKHVMLRCLHGLGDTIQFIRYAPLLRRTCRSLSVQTHPQLVTLLQGIKGIDRVFTWGPEEDPRRPEWDMQMEVTELPRAFRTTVASIPSVVPYIEIPQERVRWACGLFNGHGRLRVGLAWEAGAWDASRRIPLEAFAPLFACEGCEFYVLQKGIDERQRTAWQILQPLERHCRDIRDTGALILNLDLIISVDTMVAHLGGALGRPVWILLPAAADWRWMHELTCTPWYPTARLIRQKQPGDWSHVIRSIAQELLPQHRRIEGANHGL